MEQLVPWLIFCIAVIALCLIRPNAARIFIGFFFIVMALAVNAVLSIVAPDQFVRLGADAPLIPFYAWFFERVVAVVPQLVGILAAAGEIAVGLLILSSGRQQRQTCKAGSDRRHPLPDCHYALGRLDTAESGLGCWFGLATDQGLPEEHAGTDPLQEQKGCWKRTLRPPRQALAKLKS